MIGFIKGIYVLRFACKKAMNGIYDFFCNTDFRCTNEYSNFTDSESFCCIDDASKHYSMNFSKSLHSNSLQSFDTYNCDVQPNHDNRVVDVNCIHKRTLLHKGTNDFKCNIVYSPQSESSGECITRLLSKIYDNTAINNQKENTCQQNRSSTNPLTNSTHEFKYSNEPYENTHTYTVTMLMNVAIILIIAMLFVIFAKSAYPFIAKKIKNCRQSKPDKIEELSNCPTNKNIKSADCNKAFIKKQKSAQYKKNRFSITEEKSIEKEKSESCRKPESNPNKLDLNNNSTIFIEDGPIIIYEPNNQSSISKCFSHHQASI